MLIQVLTEHVCELFNCTAKMSRNHELILGNFSDAILYLYGLVKSNVYLDQLTSSEAS